MLEEIKQQALWRLDKTSKKYKKYIRKRKEAMLKATRRRLDKKNKETPKEYKKS